MNLRGRPALEYDVVIDCDPGRDDILAILAALGAPALHVQFITTVAGNVEVEQATSNLLRMLTLIGRTDVPVYQGRSRPLIAERIPGDLTHGDIGPEYLPLPDPAISSRGDASGALAKWCKTQGTRPKGLIGIGPLTNIGALLAEDADALAAVDDLFVMGGTLAQNPTRISPSAEFNFFSDPHAAELVLRSGVQLRLYDYDVTTSCQIPFGAVDHIADAIGEPLGIHIGSWLRQLYTYSNEPYGRVGIAVHDLYAVAGAAGIEPERWLWRDLSVDTTSEHRGTLYAQPAAESTARHAVARGLDPDMMIDFLIESCKALSM